MSGSWSERVEAGAPMKPADYANALRDLARQSSQADAVVADLVNEVAALKAQAAELKARLGRLEAPPPIPAKATKAGVKPADDGSP